MPTRVKPGGWGFAEKLTSPQITQLDANAGNAIDRLNAGVERIRYAKTFENVRSIPYLSLDKGDMVYLNGFGLYRFDVDSSAAHNPPTVITPTGATSFGRWLWDLDRNGPTRIPATSVQRGIVYAKTVQIPYVVAIGAEETKIVDNALDGDFYCEVGDIIQSTLSFRAGYYTSLANAQTESNIQAWPANPSGMGGMTVVAEPNGMNGNDPLSVSPIAHAGRSVISFALTDSKRLNRILWGVSGANPGWIGIHDIRIHTTVIRP